MGWAGGGWAAAPARGVGQGRAPLLARVVALGRGRRGSGRGSGAGRRAAAGAAGGGLGCQAALVVAFEVELLFGVLGAGYRPQVSARAWMACS